MKEISGEVLDVNSPENEMPANRAFANRHTPPASEERLPAAPTDGKAWRLDPSALASEVERFPRRLAPEAFYAAVYPLMFLSRRMEERMMELYQKGYVKGTVTAGIGNEAVAAGMALPLRPGRDVVSFLHRSFSAHLLFGMKPEQLFCQYMANADSPTHGREGNVHHGHAASRRFPMISHLGRMLSLVVGGTWAARAIQGDSPVFATQKPGRSPGEEIFGLTVIGDGGTSTGEFHEALNLASVHHVPVLFLIENNEYAFSTPVELQYHCRWLSDRAVGYGIEGKTIDGTDAWAVYSAVFDALEAMRAEPGPKLLECMTLRLLGHAAYDKGDYVPAEKMAQYRRRDPLPAARRKLHELCGLSEAQIAAVENRIEEEIQTAIRSALARPRPDPQAQPWTAFAPADLPRVEPFRAPKLKNGEAVTQALEYLLAHSPRAFLLGMDIGRYGSAFKTCKGLIDRFGPERVMDMPICESAIVGFALGASQAGGRPIIEFQFADFSTEAVTQLGLNAGTWYYRSGNPAPILLRFPCGGGLTMGAFHSGEFEGLWSRFPGLKLLYPATAQETFEALVAGFYDPNPCLVFEHKQLYWSKGGPVDFDGDLASVWRPRQYTEGSDLTVAAFGAMAHEVLAAAGKTAYRLDIWNPFILRPLNLEPLVESVKKTGRLLVVQECGAAQGLGEAIISRISCEAFTALKKPPRLLAAPDVPVPFAPELENHYRPNVEKILAAVEELMQ
jgi:2-oxoisovalerate dehydrogenase E1 component